MIEGQEGVSWEQWLALADACERLGLDGLFTSDHYYSVEAVPGRGSFDAWTVMAGLAASTERIRLGTLVSPTTFRAPAVLAKVATTVDHISGGRVELGMGAGWWGEEHRRHGLPFPPTGERFERLAEQLEIVHGLWSEDVFSFPGRHFVVEECEFLPKPVQRPHPPIVVGGKGRPRLAALAARWADEFNTFHAPPQEVARRIAGVRAALEDAGRDPATFTMSLMAATVVGADEAAFRERIGRVIAYSPDYEGKIPSQVIADLDAEGAVIGTPERAAERVRAFAAAGVDRMMFQHWLHTDLEMVHVLATRVMPELP